MQMASENFPDELMILCVGQLKNYIPSQAIRDKEMMPTAAVLFDRLPRVLRRHRLMKGWMRLTGESPIQLVRIRDKVYGFADMNEGFLRLIVIDGDYNSDFFRIADTIYAGGGTFFDVGANYGLLSFGLAGRHGESIDFHLFEPIASLVETIRRSCGKFPMMRCTINEVAVSDKQSDVEFVVDQDHTGASHIAGSNERGITVHSIALDDYIKTNNVEQIDLLKLDIEGYELAALKGMSDSLRTRRIQAVYFEYFEKQLIRMCDPRTVIHFFESVDFVPCIARIGDLLKYGGPIYTIKEACRGHGLPLVPTQLMAPPPMTDLLAVPRENLVLM
jgi:FkbM family methyltransferase